MLGTGCILILVLLLDYILSDIENDELTASKALKLLFDEGLPLERVTFSSDGNGSIPIFDEYGNIKSFEVCSVETLYEQIKTSILDYYTVVKNNDEYKLNINKFVGTKEINKAASESNINLIIKRKIIYMDYEKYEFEVKNNTKYDVMLNNLNGKSNIYVEDAYGQKYLWCSNEIIEDDVTIIRGNKKTTLIKFDKEYNPQKEAVKMIFENVLIRKSDYIDIYIGI